MRVGVVLFEGFEVLDVFGPVELLSKLPNDYSIIYAAPNRGLIRSVQDVQVFASNSLKDADEVDIVLVPGGIGTRTLVHDAAFLEDVSRWARGAKIVASVCTGSAVLAAAGLLDGYRATSNKRAFTWATEQSTNVAWVPEARWVHDRDRWTSSGVAAGMDMTVALIKHFNGSKIADQIALEIEYEPHTDADWDPYARYYGLV